MGSLYDKIKIKILIRAAIVVIMIIFVIIFISNIPIFDVENKFEADEQFINNMSKENDVCVLKYTQTTGMGWDVEKSSLEELAGKNVCLSYFFDPRLLNDNKDFDLDYLAEFVVVIDKVEEVVIDHESGYLITPKDIAILYETDKDKYKIKDMSFMGLFKSFLSVFNKQYRYIY